MNSPNRVKTIARRLALLSAGLLLQSNSLFAAEHTADAQMQARDLLSGTANGQPRVMDHSPAISSDGTHAFAVDPQDQARRLILGQPRGGGVADKTAASTESRLAPRYGDPQKLAQRMILGAGASGNATSVRHRPGLGATAPATPRHAAREARS